MSRPWGVACFLLCSDMIGLHETAVGNICGLSWDASYFTEKLILSNYSNCNSFFPSQVSVQWTGTPSTTCCHATGREMLWSSLSEEQRSLCSVLQAWILSPWRTVKDLWGWPCRKGELAAQHSDTKTRAVTATKHSLDQICFEREHIILRAAVTHCYEWTLDYYSQKGGSDLTGSITKSSLWPAVPVWKGQTVWAGIGPCYAVH